MIKVVLLGSGNVAYHLAKAFEQTKDIDFVQQYRRNSKNDKLFNESIPKTNSLENLAKADIYIIAINDDQILEFSKKLKLREGLVVHTSGSVPMDTLKCKCHKGVFYPLQTFSIIQQIDYTNIPICLETEYVEDMPLLKHFAEAISKNIYEVNSNQREKLHIAAVFANNFSNYMFKIAKDICEENHCSFDILKPLIQETVNKIQDISPEEAQTGPAKRKDKKIIDKHLSQLSGDQKKIYKLISKSISKSYQ